MTIDRDSGREKCRLCSSSLGTPALDFQTAPSSVSGLLRPDAVCRDRPVYMPVYECSGCGLIQTTACAPIDYASYVMTASHSPQAQGLQARQARRLVDWLGRDDAHVVEVGAGDGSFLEHLAALGLKVAGIEPSLAFRELAARRGHSLLAWYVTRETPPPGGPYDAFVCRQVLEHIEDPAGFLAGVRTAVRDGGVGLVEVPCVEKTIREERFFDFFPDHLSYFNRSTLRMTAELAGLDVCEIVESMDGEYLEAWIAVPQSRSRLNGLRGCSERLAFQTQRLIDEHRRAGERVVAWGGGGKGVAALAAMHLDGLDYVVDSDPCKQGLILPVSHLPIVSPTDFRNDRDGVGLVIVTALAYSAEIVQQLQACCGYLGPVALLGQGLEIA